MAGVAKAPMFPTMVLHAGCDGSVNGLARGLEPLSSTQDLAIALVDSLDQEQRHTMLLHPRAVSDLVGGNRIRVSDGDQRIPLSGLFRDRFSDSVLAAQVDRADQEMERGSGYTVADHEQVALTRAPRGLAARHMNAAQRDLLRVLLDTYFDRVAAPLYDAISQMVYALKGEDVRDVMVNGKSVVRDAKILTLDEGAILAKAEEYQVKVSASLKK